MILEVKVYQNRSAEAAQHLCDAIREDGGPGELAGEGKSHADRRIEVRS